MKSHCPSALEYGFGGKYLELLKEIAPGVARAAVSCQRGHRDARGQPLEVDGEVDAGQRFIKIIDVEKDVFFGVVKAPKFIRWQSPQAWTPIPTVG
jgi:hypothetical protein